MYLCKYCGKPLGTTIEGELVCSDCYEWEQMSPEEKKESMKIGWLQTHCAGCSAPLKTEEELNAGCCEKCIVDVHDEYAFSG